MKKRDKCLQIQQKAIPLHQVFHGIRFKVNKGWVKALTLFLYPHIKEYSNPKFIYKKVPYNLFTSS